MEVRALGPVSATIAGQRVVGGCNQLTALLGLFAVSPDCRVMVEDIACFLWGKEVPQNRISKCISELRRELRGAIGRTNSRECSLLVSRENVDCLRFEDLRHQADGLRGCERFDLLGVALSEWRGVPLQGLKGDRFNLRRAELRTEWEAAMVDQLDAALEAEKFEWVLEKTETLLELLPGRQKFFRARLLALAQDPPSVVRRRAMVNGWKADFGQPTDSGLKQAIDMLLKCRVRQSRPLLGADLQCPRQLPSVGEPLVGRVDQLDSLEKVFVEGRREGRGVLAVISGMPGVGKTALADHLAARIANLFPDGALYADLQGFSDGAAPVKPEQILDRLLADLGVHTEAAGLEGKSVALRTVLAARSVLMVLDNAAHSDQVLPLLPGGGSCAVIVTSRNALIGLHVKKEVHTTQLELLDRASAEAVLDDALSPLQRHKSVHHVARLAELCGRLPLALIVVAKQIKLRPPEAVDALVKQLSGERTRLQAMRVPDHELSVRPALDCSLKALSPEAALLLWQAAIHPGPIVSWSALMDLGRAGGAEDVARAIDELASAHLVELVNGHYRIHDLIRVYARYHAGEHIDGAGSALAERTVRLVLEHQLHHVWACDQVLDPSRKLPIGDPVDVEVVTPSGEEEAMKLLDAEYLTAMKVFDLAVAHGDSRHMWLLPMALVTYQWRRNLHADAQENLKVALFAAEGIASPAEKAMINRMLAGSLRGRNANDSAEAYLLRAVSLSEQEDGAAGQLSLANSLHALAIVCRLLGKPGEAAERCEWALEIFRGLGEKTGEAAVLNGIGTLSHDDGEYDEALQACTEALRIFETTTDLNGTANVLTTLGKIHISRSERKSALAVYQRAIEIYRELDYWRNESKALRRYADVLVSAGDVPKAVEALERTLILLEQLGGEGAQEVVDLLDGLR
ncbi:tetratricopeptide repeat protein [Streptomyces sp. NPDC050610]|uniref:AfsR/SARP family transcriptional regulator n=1 Tax=Streptomyces sp. NPDC050610 TaxID=3157097 RepID=UPI003428A7FE